MSAEIDQFFKFSLVDFFSAKSKYPSLAQSGAKYLRVTGNRGVKIWYDSFISKCHRHVPNDQFSEARRMDAKKNNWLELEHSSIFC